MARRSLATILLVEDNPDHAELALKALRTDDVTTQVIWAKDGEEALAILADRQEAASEGPRRFALAILDAHLPKIDGYEVLRRMKADPELQTIPVVMLSASESSEDVSATYGAGANSYVCKPTDFNDFTERLQTLKQYWLSTNTLMR